MAKAEEKTLEQINREIAETELQTKQLNLLRAKRENEQFLAAEERRHAANQARMASLKEARENAWAVIKACRHKSGGGPENILKGGGPGSFSLLSRFTMPDAVTVLLQCPRCRLLMYTPQKKARQMWFKTYAEEQAYFDRLLQTSHDEGIKHGEARGPTFMFKNADGVPIVPDRV